jgi:AraC family transcriptional regulator of adaptative response / DNA-3-methyladenine glycosylase II
MDASATLDFLAARAIPGVEEMVDGVYSRVLTAPGGPALVSITAGTAALTCAVRLSDHRDLVAVVGRVRRLLDLDADPVAVDAVLEADPLLAALVRKRPGLRSPGAVDGFELAVRAIVGQQIAVTSARTVLGRIVARWGQPAFEGEAWRTFPRAEHLLADDAGLPMPAARAATVRAVAAALVDGRLTLDPGADRDAEYAALRALPGIGAWTAGYVRMRALADPDVLLDTDLGIRRAAARIEPGLIGQGLLDRQARWAPWRSYVTAHLWASEK